MAYDYSEDYFDLLQFDFAPVGTGLPLQGRSRVPRQIMETVRFKIEWPSGVTTEDLSLTGLSLEIAVKQGVYKLPASQSE